MVLQLTAHFSQRATGLTAQAAPWLRLTARCCSWSGPAWHVGPAARRHPQRQQLHSGSGASAPSRGPAPPCASPAATEEAGAPAAPPPQHQQSKRPVVPPTPVPPPAVPADLSVWENAVLLVDKPSGWTSFDVCAKLRGTLAAVLGVRSRKLKVGHAGTLDPMATGLLVVCVGRGTRSVEAFMALPKEYSGTLRLGEGTPSYDADSEVAERLPWEHVTEEELAAAKEGLVGRISQLPPMFSALRVGGRRLYQAARAGEEIEREPRTVQVDSFELWRDASDRQALHFRVVCSKGTYVRSLAYDLGRSVGSVAHLTALRREASGGMRVDAGWQVAELCEQLQRQRGEQDALRAAAAAAAEGVAAAEAAAAEAGAGG